jgi:hypothetical protein
MPGTKKWPHLAVLELYKYLNSYIQTLNASWYYRNTMKNFIDRRSTQVRATARFGVSAIY